MELLSRFRPKTERPETSTHTADVRYYMDGKIGKRLRLPQELEGDENIEQSYALFGSIVQNCVELLTNPKFDLPIPKTAVNVYSNPGVCDGWTCEVVMDHVPFAKSYQGEPVDKKLAPQFAHLLDGSARMVEFTKQYGNRMMPDLLNGFVHSRPQISNCLIAQDTLYFVDVWPVIDIQDVRSRAAINYFKNLMTAAGKIGYPQVTDSAIKLIEEIKSS